MSMILREVRDLVDFINAWENEQAPPGQPNQSGIRINSQQPTTTPKAPVWNPTTGRILHPAILGTASGTTRTYSEVDSSYRVEQALSPNTRIFLTTSNQSCTAFVMSMPDAGGVSQIYCFANPLSTTFEFDPVLLQTGPAAPFNSLLVIDRKIGTVTNGMWSGAASTPSGGSATHIFFPQLTDGIPGGETVASGANVYPSGLSLTVPLSAVRLDALNVAGAPVWIDLATGLCVGHIGNFIGRYTTAPGDFFGPPIAGDSFFLGPRSLHLDSDSTQAQPKGEIFFCSTNAVTGSSPDRCYISFMDFNPFNVVASGDAPVRVHGRQTFLSRIKFDTNPMFGVGGNAIDNRYFPIYEPSSGLILLVLYDDSVANNNAMVANACVLGIWSRGVEPEVITGPGGLSIPRTNAITEYQVFIQGDIGEPVAGQVVTWSLERLWTRDEVLDASGGIGSTTNLTNVPLDAVATGPTPIMTITADGTPLVFNTDYQVNDFNTGEIEWLTDQSGASQVLSTYSHRSTPVTPSLGILLSTQSITDANGRAVASVLYADEDGLVGLQDRISASF